MKNLLKVFLIAIMFIACSNDNNENNPTVPSEVEPVPLSMSIVSEGRTWTMRSIRPNPDTVYVDYQLHGDTLINGIHYAQKFISYQDIESDGMISNEWMPTNVYLGQDGDKIYEFLKYPFMERNQLIADFSLKVGDTFTYYITDIEGEKPMYTYEVTAVTDTIIESSSDKIPRKCLYLQRGKHQMVWIDGIGCVELGVEFLPDGPDGSIVKLMKCQQGDDVLYQSDED